MSSRDISEEKLKSAASFKIDIKKFHGYGSFHDIYSFRAEFKKLVEPGLIKSLWADYLKKNLLDGAALSLVKNLEDIDEIWKGLKKSFGDPRMMLMKKLQELDFIAPLWRIKDSEKLKNSLSKVENVTEELIRLAKVHKQILY